MTSSVKLSDANFTNYVARYGNQVLAGLVGEYYFGVSSAQSAQNQSGGAAATVSGAPVYSANSAVFGSSDSFDTGIAESANMTLIVIAQRNVSGNPELFIGDYNLSDKTGLGIAAYDGTQYVHEAVVNKAPNQNASAALFNPSTFTGSGFVFMGAAFTQTSDVGFVSQAGVQTSPGTDAMSNRVVQTGRTIKVAPGAGGYSQPVTIAYAAVYNVALTLAQVQQVYAGVNSVIGSKITIL
jgi:hypothetical protein